DPPTGHRLQPSKILEDSLHRDGAAGGRGAAGDPRTKPSSAVRAMAGGGDPLKNPDPRRLLGLRDGDPRVRVLTPDCEMRKGDPSAAAFLVTCARGYFTPHALTGPRT